MRSASSGLSSTSRTSTLSAFERGMRLPPGRAKGKGRVGGRGACPPPADIGGGCITEHLCSGMGSLVSQVFSDGLAGQGAQQGADEALHGISLLSASGEGRTGEVVDQ